MKNWESFISATDDVGRRCNLFVISNKIRIATRAYREAPRLFTNHPGRCAATPPLKRRGMNSLQQLSSISKLLASRNHQKSEVYAHYIHSFRNVSDSSERRSHLSAADGVVG